MQLLPASVIDRFLDNHIHKHSAFSFVPLSQTIQNIKLVLFPEYFSHTLFCVPCSECLIFHAGPPSVRR